MDGTCHYRDCCVTTREDLTEAGAAEVLPGALVVGPPPTGGSLEAFKKQDHDSHTFKISLTITCPF